MKQDKDGNIILELTYQERKALGRILRGEMGAILRKAKRDYEQDRLDQLLGENDDESLSTKKKIKGVREFLELLQSTRLKSDVQLKREAETQVEKDEEESPPTAPT